LTDGEGCFLISEKKPASFSFQFMIYMHKDDAPMLKYICKRLKAPEAAAAADGGCCAVGSVYVYDHFAIYHVTSKKDMQKIYAGDACAPTFSIYIYVYIYNENYI